MHKVIGESQLKLHVGLASLQLLGDHLKRYLWIEISKHLLKLFVGKQTVEHLREVFWLPRANGIKFLRDFHILTV